MYYIYVFKDCVTGIEGMGAWVVKAHYNMCRFCLKTILYDQCLASSNLVCNEGERVLMFLPCQSWRTVAWLQLQIYNVIRNSHAARALSRFAVPVNFATTFGFFHRHLFQWQRSNPVKSTNYRKCNHNKTIHNTIIKEYILYTYQSSLLPLGGHSSNVTTCWTTEHKPPRGQPYLRFLAATGMDNSTCAV